MKQITSILLFFCAHTIVAQTVFINEIHYDNNSTDTNEAVEIAGPANTDLSSYSLVFYNGKNQSTYKTVALSGSITDIQNGYGVLNFPIEGIQNGAPDGVALINDTTVVQFLSYEGSFTAVDGPAAGMSSIDIGVSEPKSTPVGHSLQLQGTGTTYTDFAWNAPSSASAGSINDGQSFGTVISMPTLTITRPTIEEEFDPTTTSVTIHFTTQDFELTNGNVVAYTINGSTAQTTTSSPITIPTESGQQYTITLELQDSNGSLTPAVIETVSFSIQGITRVPDIASLRNLAIGEIATLTSEAILTFQRSVRNQKYIQDATAAILIDDAAATITTPYAIGDGITGITGRLSEFRGTLQFIPSADPGAASSTGNTSTPTIVTLSELIDTLDSYESQLVQVLGVQFINIEENEVFNTSTDYTINDLEKNLTLRTFSDSTIDYIGQPIPTHSIDIIGIAGEFDGVSQLLPRSNADLKTTILSTADVGIPTTKITIYPNPSTQSTVTITTIDPEATADILSISGAYIRQQHIVNNQLDISGLPTGMYLLKITEHQKNSSIQKLMIH